jgi:hypothetical protein
MRCCSNGAPSDSGSRRKINCSYSALKESGYIVPDFGDRGGRLFGTN